MNTVSLIGNLTKDPEMKGSEENKVCRMRVAESNGNGSPMFINVSVFGRQAETCKRYLSKGRGVAVAGRLRFREWEADGAKRSEHSITADRVDFLPGGNGKGGSGEESQA